ncbi:MAG: hypothetical protein ACYCPT_06660 [Acidimicrobiales bacterium]
MIRPDQRNRQSRGVLRRHGVTSRFDVVPGSAYNAHHGLDDNKYSDNTPGRSLCGSCYDTTTGASGGDRISTREYSRYVGVVVIGD